MKLTTLILTTLLQASVIWAMPTSIDDLMFKNLTTSEGLSSNRINSILHDSHGFLWIGSADGLDRYDAYDFHTFTDEELQESGIGVNVMYEDPKGNIIIRTNTGYILYDYSNGEFTHNIGKYLKSFGLPESYSSIGAEGRKYLWTITDSELVIYNSETDSCNRIQKQDGILTDITVKHNAVYHIYNDARIFTSSLQDGRTYEINTTEGMQEHLKDGLPQIFVDSNGHLWIHSLVSAYLFRMTQFPDRWECMNLTDEEGQFNRITAIDESPDGDIWITTSHSAGFIYKENKELFNFRHSELISTSVASDNLYTLHIDEEGTVWIGNYKNGISYWSNKSNAFISHKHKVKYDIQAFCEHDGYIWIGTDGHGLLKKPIDGDEIEEVCNTANVIRNLKADNKGRLWIGSYRNGLLCYDKGRVRQYNQSSSDIADNSIYGLQIEDDGTIWIGTLNGTLQKLDPSSGKFTTIYKNGDTNIRALLLDSEEHLLYSATSHGLFRTNTSSGLTQPVKIEGLTELVNDLYFSHDGRLWIGGEDGLFVYDPKTEKKEKINDITVISIAEDQLGRIWCCDSNTLYCVTAHNNQFYSVRYNHKDGLPACTMNEGALFRCSNNKILLGTANGLTKIITIEESAASYDANIELSNIYPIYGSLNDMLKGKSMTNADEIRIKEGFPMLMLNFSSFDFQEKGTTFSYRIIGRSEWTEVHGNTIQLSLLPAGRYELQVRARNARNVYSPNIKSITVKVMGPWYKTWWAILLYTVIACALIFIAQHAYMNKQRKELETEKEKEEAKRQNSVAEMKLQFFANISHEFRTPLSLIINPLEEFINRHPEHKKPLLNTVRNNANYLLELINQLLDFRKLDSGGEVMNYVYGDIVALVNDIMISFESIARQRDIDFTLTSPKESIMMDFDYGKVRKIITNLLSNAFKFTDDGGKIEIKAEIQDNNIILYFIYNGKGIKNEDMEKIFNCFYQGNTTGNNQGGSGIGLYLVSEYVKMHKGTLQVSSNIPHGAIFTMMLPMKVGEAIIKQDDIPSEPDQSSNMKNDRNYTLLIVDDNMDFRSFLGSSLSSEYYILTASNGKKAIEILRKESPDLIISDVMMPEMDGLQLCTAVKTDIRFSHIPIILLTAKVGEQYQIEGLEHGADDYIAKPFSMEVLKLRISKIISESIARRGIFNNEIQIEPSRITITPLDKQFIQKAIATVEANIEDPEFSVERLASELNISRGYLYKKLMMITGKIPLAFIKEIKMKIALQWLLESQLQVAEIAYKIGYSSPRIFTKHFKEVYEMTPTEYLKHHKESRS